MKLVRVVSCGTEQHGATGHEVAVAMFGWQRELHSLESCRLSSSSASHVPAVRRKISPDAHPRQAGTKSRSEGTRA
jgi:hypothetical protein